MRSNACARALTLTPFRCKCDDVEVVVSVLRFYGTKSDRHAYLRFKAGLVYHYGQRVRFLTLTGLRDLRAICTF